MSAPDDEAAPTRRALVPRPADLPFFYLLLALHGALLVALPIGGWVLAPFVRRLVALGSLPGAAPGLFLAFLVAVEFGFLLRARAVWRRIRAVRPRGGTGA